MGERGKDWFAAWRRGETPWDMGRSPPILRTLVESNALPEGRALVPGCGSGYDVLTLATPDREVIGIDAAPGAVEAFRELCRDREAATARASVIRGDFFEYSFEGRFDLIWDYTFFCAIEPERRREWAERCRELLEPGGELVTLIFPVFDRDEPVSFDEEGPPYRITPSYVDAILKPHFEPTCLEPVEESIGRREGHEWLGRWAIE